MKKTVFPDREDANPFMLASAPPTRTGEMIARAFDRGWGGAVTKSITLFPVRDLSPRLAPFRQNGQLTGMQNIELVSTRSAEIWAYECKELKKRYPDKRLWASIIAGMNRNDWQQLAVMMQKTGADALELNVSCPHGMPGKGMGAFIGQSAELTAEVTAWVKEVAEIPVIVKLTPNVTDISEIARSAKKAGADGFAAINTVAGISSINLESLTPAPDVNGASSSGGHSGPCVRPIALRCVAEIAKAAGLPVSGMGGIGNGHDALEFFAAGAETVQVCTAVMWHGYGIIDELKSTLAEYDLSKLSGAALPKLKEYRELASPHKKTARISSLCKNCGNCLVSCRDGAFQAISRVDGRLFADPEKCDGCGLCTMVCPGGYISLA